MTDPTLNTWLDELGSVAPAPGGGAAAAMAVAIGAALIEMVCRLTIGKPKYAAHEATMTAVRDRAVELRAEAVRLAEADALAFSAVAAAYRLPKRTDDERGARGGAIQNALVAAADVPLATARLAVEAIQLAESIVDSANHNLLSDVAVAAASARAGLTAAVINVEANLASMSDSGRRARIAAGLPDETAAAVSADRIVATVRTRMAA